MSRIAILHEQWFGHSEVGADEIAVLAALALHADRSGQCFPTQGLLATLLGRSRPWVNKTIARLVDLGLVVRTHRTRDDGGDRSCHYRLVQPGLDSSSRNSFISSSRNTGSHGDDSVKTDQELKQETPPASASVKNEDLVETSASLEAPNETWQPDDTDLIWAMERFPEADLHALTERFVLRCRAKGYRYRDLGAAWRSWLLEDLSEDGATRASSFGPRARGAAKAPPASYQRYQAWATVAQRGSAPHVA